MQLEAEAAGHGDVETVLDGRDAAGLVAGDRRDVAGHGVGGIELRLAPLDEDALPGVRVVGAPEFLSVGEEAVFRVGAARGAGLEDDLGIFLPKFGDELIDARGVVEPEIGALLAFKEVGTIVHEVRVGVPLDIRESGSGFEDGVDLIEDVFPDLGVGHVEDDLRGAAAAS